MQKGSWRQREQKGATRGRAGALRAGRGSSANEMGGSDGQSGAEGPDETAAAKNGYTRVQVVCTGSGRGVQFRASAAGAATTGLGGLASIHQTASEAALGSAATQQGDGMPRGTCRARRAAWPRTSPSQHLYCTPLLLSFCCCLPHLCCCCRRRIRHRQLSHSPCQRLHSSCCCCCSRFAC